jgi:hypothetical protein
MTSGRFFTVILFLLFIGCLPAKNTRAFWGFGDDQGKSGLDFEKGYDLNTVTTIKGKTVSVETDDKGPVTIVLKQGDVTIHAIVAPKWYWSDRGIIIKPGDEVEVSGAKAQGKDGNMYIISREIANLATGEAVTLRNGTGKPAWSGGGRVNHGGTGMQRRFGGRMRGR